LIGLRPVALAAFGTVLLGSGTLLAQPVSITPGPPSSERGLLPRYRFHLAAESLQSSDARFDWDADIGGDLDVVDYGVGRISAVANVETILGQQFRHFDPNQGNYTLDVSASLKTRLVESALVFHHISRHLSDRPKAFPVDWNMLGLRAARDVARGQTRLQIAGRALWTLKRSFVDYGAEVGVLASFRHEINPRLALIGVGDVYGLLVDKSVSTRSHQNGGSIEGGVRVSGSTGAVEFFIGFERRVDADALESLPRSWALVGFRLLKDN
jgi:hypothetical protein